MTDPVLAFVGLLEDLAADAGRLRRRIDPAREYDRHLCDRIAGHVLDLDAVVQPTAADLFRSYITDHELDDGRAAAAALAAVDRRSLQLRHLLGLKVA
ncbi:MAG: hypothetical protein ACRDL2_10755 [Gaiellaceae bacterium]